MDLLDFARGPALQVAAYIFVAGIIWRLVGIIMLKKRSQGFSEWVDRMSLKLPIVGGILEQAAIARFCRTLAITFAAGVGLMLRSYRDEREAAAKADKNPEA